jgi:hypothetical protein
MESGRVIHNERVVDAGQRRISWKFQCGRRCAVTVKFWFCSKEEEIGGTGCNVNGRV